MPLSLNDVSDNGEVVARSSVFTSALLKCSLMHAC